LSSKRGDAEVDEVVVVDGVDEDGVDDNIGADEDDEDEG